MTAYALTCTDALTADDPQWLPENFAETCEDTLRAYGYCSVIKRKLFLDKSQKSMLLPDEGMDLKPPSTGKRRVGIVMD